MALLEGPEGLLSDEDVERHEALEGEEEEACREGEVEGLRELVVGDFESGRLVRRAYISPEKSASAVDEV